MRQLDILGIRLREYPLREGIRVANGYLKSGALNTIVYLSNQVLVNAGEEPLQKEWIEGMDMTVFGNTDILRAAGVDNRNRIHEIENDEFFREFMKRVLRERKTVFLVADTETALAQLKDRVLSGREELEIAGSYLLDELSGGQDSMINEINDVAPGVIVSCLPFEVQAQYMYEYRRMINADVWLGLLGEQLVPGSHAVFESLREKYFKRIFRRRVIRYKQENKEKYH